MSIDLLKTTCDQKNIQRVAIIDDVFDPPMAQKLNRTRFREFRAYYNADLALRRAVVASADAELNNLPRFDDLDDDLLKPFWDTLWRHRLGYHTIAPAHADLLKQLFAEHDDDPLRTLDEIFDLYSLFKFELGRAVIVGGTDYDVPEIAQSQIVVVDYFLGPRLNSDEALGKLTDAVTTIVQFARTHQCPIPSFLLVSNRDPDKVDTEGFRRESRLMRSRFGFFRKGDLHSDRTTHMVSLHDLIESSDRTAKIEALIHDWNRATGEVSRSVSELMLNLDVADLVYLDYFRLTHEGTSIGNYLRWLLTAALSAKVTAKLTKELWIGAQEPGFFALVDETANNTGPLPTTFSGPSDSVADIYGEILFDESRGRGASAFPVELAPSDLVEGDLFVLSTYDEQGPYDNARVLLVMTPSSDLRRRVVGALTANSVLLLPGMLRLVTRETQGSSLTDADYVRVQEGAEAVLFQVTWEYDRPLSKSWSEMLSIGPDDGYVRLGRIRDLYFHKIRNRFVHNLSRISTEVAPLLPHAKDGEVSIQLRGGARETIMKFSSSERLLWEIGPVRVTDRSSPLHVYQASRKFIDVVAESLAQLAENKPEHSDRVQECTGILQDMTTYLDLIRPSREGTRGSAGKIQLKAIARDSQKRGSQAALLVLVYKD